MDDLLSHGFVDLTGLDISSAALDRSRQRLGHRADLVDWITADIIDFGLPRNRFDVCHDRAVFHFLTDAEDRRKYVEQVMHSLKPGGHLIVASFGPQGPLKCSGLDVVRYSPESMHHEFGEMFDLIESRDERHTTPSGMTQEFVYCYCRRSDEK